jgi:methylmalonyl-CoA mutase N-terminal domain/subunit
MAAILGGTQSLHTNALDEALGLPTESSARLALRTQQILFEESGLANTVDPLGGAYEIEWLTDRIESEAREYLARIEALGGAMKAVERGFFQSEIAKESYRVAQARERKEELVVGVNAQPEGNPSFDLFAAEGRSAGRFQKVSPKLEVDQRRRVLRWRKARDARAAQAALDGLRRATERGENVLPPTLAAVKAGVTLGEIADTWRALFGEYKAPKAF